MRHGLAVWYEDELPEIEAWLGGNQLEVVSTTGTAGLWGTNCITWVSSGDDSKDASLERVFGNTDRTLCFHFPHGGSGTNNGDYSTAANGGYDAEYRRTAEELVELGMGDTIVRPSAEFNQDWSQRYPRSPADYRDSFARCVNSMQSVPGANFTFLYATSGRTLGVADDCWPVDSPLWPSGERAPLVDHSMYDAWWDYPAAEDDITQAHREQAWEEVHRPRLELWREFADTHGASGICSVEWGCATPEWESAGGGDNPYFITQMFEYFEAHRFEYQAYWNHESNNPGSHRIFPRNGAGLPAASDRFRDIVTDGLAQSSRDSGEDVAEDPPTAPLFEDWTPEWHSDYADWDVVEGEEFIGGHALLFDPDGAERQRHALAFGPAGELSNVEILDKFRVPEFTPNPALGFHARVYLRASGSAGAENGYLVEIENRNEAFRLAKYTDGEITTIDRFSTPEPNRFYWRRCRLVGEDIMVKVWPSGETEPTEWNVETTDQAIVKGWIGLGSLDTRAVETDAFSIGMNGAEAPFPKPRLEVDMHEPAEVGPDHLTLSGELTHFEGIEEATLVFEWGEAGSDFPYVTDALLLDGVGSFTHELENLDADTEYEYRAVAQSGDLTTVTDPISSKTLSAADPAPTIDSVEVTLRENSTWSRFDIQWVVSHESDHLEETRSELRDEGCLVAEQTEDVNGRSAAMEHTLCVDTTVDEIRLEVGDSNGGVTRKTIPL